MKSQPLYKYDALLHHIMSLIGGFFGAYALINRCENFGSSETSNMIYLLTCLLGGSFEECMLRAAALVIYMLGIYLTVILPKIMKINLHIASICIDAVCLIILTMLPENMNFLVALYPVFFATSFQWNSFSTACGYSSATIFSTNNLRQTVIGFSEYFVSRDGKKLAQGKFFGMTLICYHIGVVVAFFSSKFFGTGGAIVCLIPVCAAMALALNERNERLKAERVQSSAEQESCIL